PWNTNNLYLQAVVGKIKEGLANFPISSQKLVPLIFSAHSLPLKYAESDPYVEEIKKTIHEIMKLIENKEWYLAFQSPGREGEWLSPEIGVVLDRLGKSGKKEILVVPLSFVSDHLETLYDLDIILKKKADKLGINFQRVASFNDSADFIEVLSEVIIAFIES
ncbi:MAG: ferrochelatase, partial [Desulfobacterota bacterium]|nr:ferrochelatase [Thermodesulfobacteriota bacterium]